MAKQTAASNDDKPFEMKEGQFMVFKNNSKEKVTQPDLWGKCMVNGKELRVSFWVAEGKSGTKYWSGQINDYRPEAKSDNVDL
jgi:hypothetical protein